MSRFFGRETVFLFLKLMLDYSCFNILSIYLGPNGQFKNLSVVNLFLTDVTPLLNRNNMCDKIEERKIDGWMKDDCIYLQQAENLFVTSKSFRFLYPNYISSSQSVVLIKVTYKPARFHPLTEELN